MDKVKWQDLLNVLTLKGTETGVNVKVHEAQNYQEKYELCSNETRCYLEEWLTFNLKDDKKDASKADEFRLRGNKVYQKGEDFHALNHYNLSAVFAPFNTNQYALALSNRSAVLARLDKNEEAIRDIDLALEHGNDDIPRVKIQNRKAILLHKLGLYEECLSLITSLYDDEQNIKELDNADLKNAYFDSLEKAEVNKFSGKATLNEDIVLPLPKGGESNTFASASVHASLQYSEEKGRHVIAEEDFETSDIIFVEKPFALVVLPDEYWTNCHNCCKQLLAYIPCVECTKALFCSEECRIEAWQRYHRWECKGLEVFHSIGIAHLGLRVALLADNSPRYKQVYDLVTHIHDMKPDDIYQYTMTAALLTLYLEKFTNYFVENTVKVEEMGSRILRHIAQLVCNGHAIIKVDSRPLPAKGFSQTTTEEQLRIATAIYPSASMMNHSCDQNITNQFINENLIVKASRKIKKGEEIFNCYGPHFSKSSKEERQEILQSQYHFACHCTACEKDDCDEERLQFMALLCAVCAGPIMEGRAACAHCDRTQPLFELVELALSAQQLYHKGLRLMKDGNAMEAQVCMEECIQVASKCLYKHNVDLRTYIDALARIYAETGRNDLAIPLVEDCITSVTKQFGDESTEVIQEYKKLYSILVSEVMRLEGIGDHTQEHKNMSEKMSDIWNKIEQMEGKNKNDGQQFSDERSGLSDIFKKNALITK